MAKIRAAVGDQRHRAAHNLATPALAINPLSRPCPKCQAQPNQRCRRWTGGRVEGKDVGGGYWRPLRQAHAERKRHRAKEG